MNTDSSKSVPKKRGRKPGSKNKKKIDNPSPVEKVKKKRGRKPKNMVETDNSKKEENVITVRRRGRKPKDKFNYETANFSDYQNSVKRNENVIIKLPISCLKIEKDYQISKDFFRLNFRRAAPSPVGKAASNQVA